MVTAPPAKVAKRGQQKKRVLEVRKKPVAKEPEVVKEPVEEQSKPQTPTPVPTPEVCLYIP